MNRSIKQLVSALAAALVAAAVLAGLAPAPAQAGTKWWASPDAGTAGTVAARTFPGATTSTPDAAACTLPPLTNPGAATALQWSPTKARPELGQDTFYRFTPFVPAGTRDRNWFVSPHLGKLYTRVVYRDAKGVCHRDGHMLVQYGVKLRNYPWAGQLRDIDLDVPVTRAVFTWRSEWRQLIGVEISVLPLQPVTRYYASWQPAGNRTQVTAAPAWLVEHNNPAPTMWKVGTATQLHWVVNPRFRPFVQVMYRRSGVTHVVTDRTLSPYGTLDILLPQGSTIVATLVSGS